MTAFRPRRGRIERRFLGRVAVPSESGLSASGQAAPESNFGSFSQEQSIFDIDTKIPDRVFNFGVTEQNLDRP